MFILDETQDNRDFELSHLMNVPVDTIRNIKMCSPDTIRIHDSEEEVADMVELYRDLRHLDLVGYYRTLMMTSVERRHPNLIELLRESTGECTCLDFGSGVGTHAIALMQKGNNVSLLDVPGPLLEFALQRIINRGLHSNLNVSYSHNSELPDNEFDIVICADVIEHVPEPLAELERIQKCMKPGAILHLEVSTMIKPSSGHFLSSIQKWKGRGTEYLSERFTQLKPTIFRRN